MSPFYNKELGQNLTTFPLRQPDSGEGNQILTNGNTSHDNGPAWALVYIEPKGQSSAGIVGRRFCRCLSDFLNIEVSAPIALRKCRRKRRQYSACRHADRLQTKVAREIILACCRWITTKIIFSYSLHFSYEFFHDLFSFQIQKRKRKLGLFIGYFRLKNVRHDNAEFSLNFTLPSRLHYYWHLKTSSPAFLQIQISKVTATSSRYEFFQFHNTLLCPLNSP